MPWLLALKLLSSSVATSSSNACEETDLSCLHGKLLDQAIEIDSLGHKIAISLDRVKTAEELAAVWKEASRSARESLTEAEKALRPTPFYREPILWFAIGGIVVGTVVLVLAYALKPLFLSQ